MGNHRRPFKTVLKLLAAGAVAGIVLAMVTLGSYHAAGSPAFCLACHSMQDVGGSWKQSNHKQFACIECHLPDSNVAVQAAYKAKVGVRDLYYETLRSYPANIKASAESWEIAEGNCLRCHYSTVESTFMVEEGGACLKCHHGLVHGSMANRGGICVK